TPLVLRELLSENAVPPHHNASDEHCRRSESGKRPNELCDLIAKPGAVAWNSNTVNAAEMQVGKPVGDLIDDSVAGIGFGRRLDVVREVLKHFGKGKIGAAESKQQNDAQRPEPHHAVQFPREAPPPDVTVNDQASLPRLDSRPPDNHSR